jgi:hypothetical protein
MSCIVPFFHLLRESSAQSHCPSRLRLAAIDGDRNGFPLANEDDEPLPSDHAWVEEVLTAMREEVIVQSAIIAARR